MEITDLLMATHRNKASDLHLSSKNPPLMRVHGDILPLDMPPLTDDQIKVMIYAIMTDQQRSDFEREKEVDFSISFSDDMRFRVNSHQNSFARCPWRARGTEAFVPFT